MKRYVWLDGLRGFASLFVLLHHASEEVNSRGLSKQVVNATAWLKRGHLAVAVFIVLSGFSLMLPIARDGRIRGGLRGYFVRRGRRILPAYYASLALTLLLIAMLPPLQIRNGNERWDFALPALNAQAIIPHLLLVHDLSSTWIFKIDPPMWSVAVEWQIYFLFPILIQVWRRFGHPASLTVALMTSYALVKLMGNLLSKEACPWYVFLFAVGMLAASSKVDPVSLFSRIPWPFWLVPAVLTLKFGSSNRYILNDLIVGLMTASALAILARFDRGEETPDLLIFRKPSAEFS